MSAILIAISPGELLDRISILQLKVQHASNPAQRAAIQGELNALLEHQRHHLPASPDLNTLAEELATVNRQLWDAEDQLRLCEKRCDFASAFVELARSIYQNNDRRCELRRRIDLLLGRPTADLKIYAIDLRQT